MDFVLEKSGKSNSPFRYPGGKFYARKLILGHLHETGFYCEPFAGGGSIFFAKQRSKVSWLNDLDEDVVNTFLHIRDHLEELARLLNDVEATKESHSYFKNEYVPKSDLERAFRWYFLNRTSYSGIMKPENCYFGYHPKYSMRPENWVPHLRTVSEKLQDVLFTSLDFEKVIEWSPQNSMVFIDPPYFKADQKKFYIHGFNEVDHERLSWCLRKNSSRIKFLVTYDNCPEVHALYSWCATRTSAEWQYTISRTDDQKNGQNSASGFKSSRSNGKELLIKNFQ